MSREILLPAANLIHSATVEYMEDFVERDATAIITPIHLDVLEDRLRKSIKEKFSESVSRNFVRQEIVAMILKYHGPGIFGVPAIKSTRPMPKQITDAAIKKYAKKK